MSEAWLVSGLVGAAVGSIAAWGLRRRPEVAVPLPGAARGEAASRAAGDPAARVLSGLVEHLAAPVVVLDRSFAIRFSNAPARLLLGDAAAALLRHPAMRAAVAGLEAGRAVSVEIALDVPVQRRLRAGLMRLPEPLAGDGLVSIVLDDRTQTLALDQMRADFVANASHELRTPLASLIGFIDTLRGPAADDPPAQRRFLDIMAGQAQRMRRLIDNLLSLSRVQMVEHERPRGHLAPGALAERVAAELRPLFETRGQVLDVAIAADLPRIAADADQIAQVIQNLLDNASKYGKEGGRAVLSVGRAPRDAGSDGDPLWPTPPGVVIAVCDDGPGIAAQHIPRLTERFYRVEENAPGQAGSGLGLAIVKHIVGRHRGRLAIDSAPGRGAAFRVWLPAETANTPAPPSSN